MREHYRDDFVLYRSLEGNRLFVRCRSRRAQAGIERNGVHTSFRLRQLEISDGAEDLDREPSNKQAALHIEDMQL